MSGRINLTFAFALTSGDLELAAGCFAREGCLITPDATAIHGRDNIRPVLAQLIATRIEIEVQLSNAVGGGGVAIASERWRVRFGVAGGRRVQTIHPTFVLHRIDSAWKLAIAAPWGWADGRT